MEEQTTEKLLTYLDRMDYNSIPKLAFDSHRKNTDTKILRLGMA
jgi:ferritin-like metal-binding protein YciE